MSDQAETLRKLMSRRRPQENHSTAGESGLDTVMHGCGAPVITVASGKGGVGKSCLTSHLGTLLARSGHRVLLVDGDFGLANLDILLGVQSGATIEQVLEGEARLQDTIVGVEPNLWLLPSASGLMELRNSTMTKRRQLAELFLDCPWEMDVILVDVGAGIQPNVLTLHSTSFKSVIVLTPEPTSLTDAYGLIKVLRRETAVAEFHVVVNQVTDAREARATFQRLKDVADRFIDVRMEMLGHWDRDEKITQAVMNRKILLDWESEAGSIPSLRSLAKGIEERFLVRQDPAERPGQIHGMARESARVASVAGNTTRFWMTLLGSASGGMPARA